MLQRILHDELVARDKASLDIFWLRDPDLLRRGETEAMLRRVRRLFVNRDNLRRAVTRLVNATFVVRDEALWEQGTACASDSKKFRSWSANFMTEYHVSYEGAGVMITGTSSARACASTPS